ncbi:MAG: ACP S-malonyltransferase [Thermoanaerobaculales bacterium]
MFPGQGSQAVGMGQDLAERWPLAAEVFDRVDRGLGSALSELCWQGPEEDLRLTENTQPALLAHSMAAWSVLSAGGLEVEAVAGHSLGEYSAVVAAGGLGVADAARTVRRRGRLMQEAVPVGEGAMAAVIGLTDDEVVDSCREEEKAAGGTVVAVNFNSPGQVVIAGTAEAVAGAGERCKARGARRAVPLPVSAPFHSPLMAQAREGLEPTLRGLDFQPLAVPLYRNVDAVAVRSPEEVCAGLVRQVDAPVLWSEIIRRMLADGFDTFVEVGAGNVLCGLVRRIDRTAVCFPAGTVETVENVLNELQ